MTTTFCNLRDVGGAALVGGGTVPYGVLYRGDAPLAGDTAPELSPWPPGGVIDLRGPSEQVTPPDFWPAAVRVVEVNLMPDADPRAWADPDADNGAALLVPLYRGMAQRSDLLVPIATAAATLPAPVFVHCAGGKDRTAIVIALLLEVAGVETDAIVADQLLSNEALDALLQRFHRALGVPLTSEVPQTLEVGMHAALEVWRGHPGGAAGWLVANGMDAGLVEQLRARLRS